MVFGDARVCCDLILERFLPNNILKKRKRIWEEWGENNDTFKSEFGRWSSKGLQDRSSP